MEKEVKGRLILVLAVCSILLVCAQGEVKADADPNAGTVLGRGWVDLSEKFLSEGFPYFDVGKNYTVIDSNFSDSNGSSYSFVGKNYFDDVNGGFFFIGPPDGGDDSGFLPGDDTVRASNPSPDDGELEVSPDTILSWEPGDFADLHQVYFGTDFTEINEANEANGIHYEIDVNHWDPFGLGLLDLGTTYYWRIDERSGVNKPYKGYVWSFTTANYIVIDDMESYVDPNIDNDVDPNDAIYVTWIDGIVRVIDGNFIGGNGTGSEVRLEREIIHVHGGGQSMKFVYDNNDPNFSKTRRFFSENRDWTVLGVKALSLWFYGDPNNDVNSTEQFYLGVEDGFEDGDSNFAEILYGFKDGEDMNDFDANEWQEWNIELADFSDAGVNLTDINNIYIGSGDPNGAVAGGSGFVFFDDIRLYIPRCRPELLAPDFALADIDDDCIIGYSDLQFITDDWLLKDEIEAGGTGNSPLESPGNIYDAETDFQVVNFRDFALIAAKWLQEELWPAP